MTNKLPWIFVVALLLVDLFMLVERNQNQARIASLSSELQSLESTSQLATFRQVYSEEEQRIVASRQHLPINLSSSGLEDGPREELRFLLYTSIEDCTNCIEDEIYRLNKLVEDGANHGRFSAAGNFIDAGKGDATQRFIENLTPPARFPMSIEGSPVQPQGATTPLVVVVLTRDGLIVDAHKPIPEDRTRSDAFYAKWEAALGIENLY